MAGAPERVAECRSGQPRLAQLQPRRGALLALAQRGRQRRARSGRRGGQERAAERLRLRPHAAPWRARDGISRAQPARPAATALQWRDACALRERRCSMMTVKCGSHTCSNLRVDTYSKLLTSACSHQTASSVQHTNV